jgi:N-methylhydantoinase A
MRYRGQGHELAVEIPARIFEAGDGPALAELFELQYQKNYGRRIPNLTVEALTWTLVLSVIDEGSKTIKLLDPKPLPALALRKTRVFDAEIGDFVEAQVISREGASAGAVVEEQTTVWVPSSFNGRISAGGHVILERKG